MSVAPAATAAEEGGTRKRYRLGVLFVHGIGRQPKGDTLVRWGEAILGCLRAAGGATEPAVVAEVVDARVTGEASEAAMAEVRISQGIAEPDSWLFCEAWWAESFATPSFGRLVSWSVHIVPWSIVLHFARSIDRSLSRVREAERLTERLVAAAGLVLGSLAGLLVGVLLAPAIVLLLAGLLAIGLLPVPRVRSFVAAVQRSLAGSLGDSLVLLESPIQAAAIRSRVREELDRMADQCDRVAVLAHSQGAAIAHQALGNSGGYRVPDEVETLITFGSGVNKLELLERLIAAPGEGRGSAEGTGLLASLWRAAAVRRGSPASPRSAIRLILAPMRTGLLASPWSASLLLAALVGSGLWIRAQLAAGLLEASDFIPFLVFIAAVFALPFIAQGLRWLALRCRLSPQSATNAAAAATMLLWLLLAGWFVVLSPRIENPRPVIVPFLVLSYAAVVITGLIVKVHDDEAGIDLTLPASVRRWLDLWATADPVPNGPTRGRDIDRPSSVAVCNCASPLRDHNLYWGNREEFVARVTAALVETAGGPSGLLIPEPDLERAGRRRRARVGALRASRWVVSLAAVVFLVRRWEAAMALGSVAMDRFSPVLMELPLDPTPLVAALGLPQVIGLGLVLVAGLAAYSLVVAGWKVWDAHDGGRFLECRPPSRWPPVMFTVLLAAVLALAWLAEPTTLAVIAAWRGEEVSAEGPSILSLWFLVLIAGGLLGAWVSSRFHRQQ